MGYKLQTSVWLLLAVAVVSSACASDVPIPPARSSPLPEVTAPPEVNATFVREVGDVRTESVLEAVSAHCYADNYISFSLAVSLLELRESGPDVTWNLNLNGSPGRTNAVVSGVPKEGEGMFVEARLELFSEGEKLQPSYFAYAPPTDPGAPPAADASTSTAVGSVTVSADVATGTMTFGPLELSEGNGHLTLSWECHGFE